MITLYGIKNCNTMKKAFDFLAEHNIPYSFHNYKTDKIDRDLINFFLSLTSYDNLINRKGLTWRNLPDETKQNLNETVAIELMLQNPSIIKRPILIQTKKERVTLLIIGLDLAEYEKLDS